jgi:ABC-type proline/glycine betaine transport system substrate-binding protein
MAMQAYRLTFTLRLAGSEADTTRQTVTIAAPTAGEAVELAQVYRSGLPKESVVSATLADADGAVIWSEQADGTPDAMLLQEDGP